MRRLQLLPDEHIYSGMIRERYLSGQMYISEERFFDENNIPPHRLRAQVPLHHGIKSLIETACHDDLERQRLWMGHTGLPIWLLSLGYEDIGRVIQQQNHLDELRIRIDRRWKMCMQCCEDNRRRFGVSYWHTQHQLPGVMRCWQHGCNLNATGPHLTFHLPQHIRDQSESIEEVSEWEVDWQPFIYSMYQKLLVSPEWVNTLKSDIRQCLNIPDPVRTKDRAWFKTLFEEMKDELGLSCMAGLFKGFGHPTSSREPNVLLITLSGLGARKNAVHPVYWLAVIFWLRKRLPSMQFAYENSSYTAV